MSIIPLGFNCSVALTLQAGKLRNAAFPFDWIRPRYYYIYNLLKCNTDEEIEKFMKDYFSDKNFNTDIWRIDNENGIKKYFKKCLGKDGSDFPHAGKAGSWHWDEDVVPTYIRRAKRLKNYIETKEVLIFISGHYGPFPIYQHEKYYPQIMKLLLKKRKNKITYFITYNLFVNRCKLHNHHIDLGNIQWNKSIQNKHIIDKHKIDLTLNKRNIV